MLYIMRHGKTDWNAKHKLQGHADIPLNEEGRQMAEKAGEEYDGPVFDVCYCSPLVRAKETAENAHADYSGSAVDRDEFRCV